MRAKRVSASKMTSLTELALKSMDVRYRVVIYLHDLPYVDQHSVLVILTE